MNLDESISELEQLADRYNKERLKGRNTKVNRIEYIDLYQSWFAKAKSLFTQYLGSNDSELKDFSSYDISGNGHELSGNFTRQFPLFKIMVEKALKPQNSLEQKEPNMKLFISHSSKDEEVVNSFVNNILRLGCGISDDEIFCTSIDGLGITSGEDFRYHIYENLNRCAAGILLITENYKASEICLNEMGALWVLDKRIFPFILPPINFQSVGMLMNVRQILKLNDPKSLDQFHEDLKEVLPSTIRVSRWNTHKENFLNDNWIRSPKSSQELNFAHDYFLQFVQPNANIRHLIMKAQPTLLDCKALFDRKYFQEFHELLSKGYSQMHNEPDDEPFYPKYKYIRCHSANVNELMMGHPQFPGGMKQCALAGIFNYEAVFYEVDLLAKEDDDGGSSMKAFSFVNDRWVFVPRPWDIFHDYVSHIDIMKIT